LAQQFLDVLGGPHFEMAEVLPAGLHQPSDGLLEAASGAGGQHGQGFRCEFDGFGGGDRVKAVGFHPTSLTPTCKKLRCALPSVMSQ
jgi:hypothetical protein